MQTTTEAIIAKLDALTEMVRAILALIAEGEDDGQQALDLDGNEAGFERADGQPL